MDMIVHNLINDIKRLGISAPIKNLERIGCGHFSVVFSHPEDANKVIKLTNYDVNNDGYPTFVEYVQSKQGYSIYPVIHEFHEGTDKNGRPFYVTVLERLFGYYTIEEHQRDSIRSVYNALCCVDNYFMIEAQEDPEMISKLFQRYKNSIEDHWEDISLADRLEIREVHDMIFALCAEWEQEWGLAPDIGGDNIMVRIDADGKCQCVVTDPLACGDIYHSTPSYIEELMA